MSHGSNSRPTRRTNRPTIIRTLFTQVWSQSRDRSPNAQHPVALHVTRSNRPLYAPFAAILASLAAVAITGCAGDAPSSRAASNPAPTSTRAQSPAKVAMQVDSPEATAAIAAGQRIAWSPLRDRLAEAAGGIVLEELALDAAIEEELTRQGVTITDALVKAEDALLRRAIILDARMTADQAERAVIDLRRREGLGPKRYADLLRRNAKLRALARATLAERLRVSDDEARAAAELATGPRARARIIVVDSDRAAANVREQIVARVGAGEPPNTAFANAAIIFSRDPSATRGGLMDGVSAADPIIPEGVRRSLRTLRENTVSDVLPLDNGAALLLVEARTPGGEPNRADIDAARQRVELRKERVAMDEIATRLLNNARITIYDESLRWSWESRRE